MVAYLDFESVKALNEYLAEDAFAVLVNEIISIETIRIENAVEFIRVWYKS